MQMNPGDKANRAEGVGQTAPAHGSETEAILFRRATPHDLGTLRAFLERAKLPSSDVDTERQDFILAAKDGRLVGSIALEVVGTDALVRSLAVAPEHQGRGVGVALNERVMGHARSRGVKVVYLLTTTAKEYAQRRGFELFDRNQVPTSIAELPQFRGLCPVSASCLRLCL